MTKIIKCRILIAVMSLFICLGMSGKDILSGTKHIDRIVMEYSPLVFDGETSRQREYNLTKKKWIEIRDNKTITEFFETINSLDYDNRIFASPYADLSEFMTPGHLNKTYKVYSTGGEVEGFATVYFNDGRLPEMIWFSCCSIFYKDRVYKLTLEASKHLYEIQKISENNKAFPINPVTKLSTDGIEQIVIKRINNNELKDGVSREKFVEITNDTASTHTLVKILKDPISISKMMDLMVDLKYKNTLYYNTDSPAIVATLRPNGTFGWKTTAGYVDTMLQIYYTEPSEIETIWITSDSIERSYFQFYLNEELNSLIEALW